MDTNQNDKLSKLLSDPQSLAMLASVAKSFMESNTASTNESNTQTIKVPAEDTQSNTDLPKQIVSVSEPTVSHTSHFDERANLLRSIRPYLKAERQPKVDSLLKAINIAKIINSYTGSNLF